MTDYLDWYSGRSVVVTGGLGFIGSNLALALDKLGARVTIIDASIPGLGANPHNVVGLSDRSRVDKVDLRDTDALIPLLAQQDCIFNLAGQVSHIDSMTNPLEDLDLNCCAQLSLLESVRNTSPETSVVFASTRQVYGRPDNLPINEAHPTRPADVNGINKRAAEQYHHLYGEVYGIRSIVLRLTNTYGPRQLMHHGRQGFIPVFIRAAMENEPIFLYGGGHQTRDTNYVDDVVDAFMRCGPTEESSTGSTYNLGSTPASSLRTIAETVVAIVGSGSIVDVPWPEDRALIDIGDAWTDHTAITNDLGWKPAWTLSQGVVETVAFYLKHGNHY